MRTAAVSGATLIHNDESDRFHGGLMGLLGKIRTDNPDPTVTTDFDYWVGEIQAGVLISISVAVSCLILLGSTSFSLFRP